MMMPERRIQNNVACGRIHAKRAIPHLTTKAHRNVMTCVLVTALCNQPEAFALDLGDDQSCYLLYRAINEPCQQVTPLCRCLGPGCFTTIRYAQTPLASICYKSVVQQIYNKSTTNWTSGVWALGWSLANMLMSLISPKLHRVSKKFPPLNSL